MLARLHLPPGFSTAILRGSAMAPMNGGVTNGKASLQTIFAREPSMPHYIISHRIHLIKLRCSGRDWRVLLAERHQALAEIVASACPPPVRVPGSGFRPFGLSIPFNIIRRFSGKSYECIECESARSRGRRGIRRPRKVRRGRSVLELVWSKGEIGRAHV